MREQLERIIQDPERHALWLNTLSYLENCGARAIAACEHPTIVKKEMLKHAAEEFRHAYYLKAQIQHLGHTLPDYTALLGGYTSRHYLSRLNTQICRYLKSHWNFTGDALKEHAYILVTYAIEVRAESLYPLYQELLKKYQLPISVISIIREEEHHLAEMKEELAQVPHGEEMGRAALDYEKRLYEALETQLALQVD